jgi:branched-chain amino acid transport system substrate-binding protein
MAVRCRLRFWALGAMAVAVAAVAAGCGSTGKDESGGGGGGGTVKVGLVVPQSGVYVPVGKDMKAGWDFYLRQHGGKLGGRKVETVVADEGEGPATGVPAIQKLIQRDKVDVMVGVVNSATALGARDIVDQSKHLMIISNAGANDLTGKAGSPYIWRTSFTNSQVSFALGKYLAKQPQAKGGVYSIAADYAAGVEHVAGFKKGFTAGGGKIVGKAATPFGKTQDFQPFISKIPSSGAAATFAFYAGAEAVSFVKQYDQFGLKGRVPLYGSGFLTEGGVLVAQKGSADGVRTSLHYSDTLDNPANKSFVAAYKRSAGVPPTVYAMQTWDAGLVLDKAIQDANSVEGQALSKSLDSLGPITDSPRGEWSFQNRGPKQHMYLREVKGGSNQIIEDLGVFGPVSAG